MKKYEHHELSNLFPMMSEAQFFPLLEGMRKFGYDKDKPVTLFEGKILDGRNRNKAASIIGITPTTKEFIPNGITPLDFVIRENLSRRHLNSGQLAFVSLSVYDAIKDQFTARDRFNNPTEHKGRCNQKRAEAVAKMFGVGRTTVTSAITMRRHCPSLIKRVVSGEITLSKALKLMPKIRNMQQKEIEENKQALEVLKKFDYNSLNLPTVFDSYEKFHGEHIKKLNDHGYNMQAIFCARKVYVQIVKNNENFKTWVNQRSEYDFRLAVVAMMNEVIKK